MTVEAMFASSRSSRRGRMRRRAERRGRSNRSAGPRLIDVRLESLIKAGKDATAGGEAWAFEPLGGTTPHGGVTSPIRYTEGGEQKRDAVNRWIRSSGAYDGVI